VISCVYTIAALNWLGYTINISFHALIGGVIVGLSLACIVWISTWIGPDSEEDE
jgi:ABC-type amino acid transport system permease subunit